MKSLGESFGFEILLTVLLPGLAVCIGLLAVEPNVQSSMRSSFPAVVAFLSGEAPIDDSNPTDAGTSPKTAPPASTSSREWLKIFAVIAIVSLLGAAVGAVNGFLETIWYDRFTPALLGIDSDTFLAHWDEYLYRLGKESNSYVDRIVNWFLFESRMAVAIAVILAVGLLDGEITNQLVVYLGIAAIAFAIVAMMHHYELGKYRMSRSTDWQAMRTAEVAVAERQLVEAANAPGIAARLDVAERELRRLRKKMGRRVRWGADAAWQ